MVVKQRSHVSSTVNLSVTRTETAWSVLVWQFVHTDWTLSRALSCVALRVLRVWCSVLLDRVRAKTLCVVKGVTFSQETQLIQRTLFLIVGLHRKPQEQKSCWSWSWSMALTHD